MLLGPRLLAREWRGGELGVLLAAAVLAVAIVTGIGLFADRLGNAINQQSSNLLGADLVLESPRPLEPGAVAMPPAVTVARAVQFASMLSAADRFQLAALRAVDASYPAKGEIKLARELFGAPESVRHGPAPGEMWADARIYQALRLAVGDSVEIGDTRLRLTGVLISEPAGSLSALAPSAMMHWDDLAAAQVVQPGSRVEYTLYFTGAPDRIAALRARLQPQLLPEQRLYDVREGQPRVAKAIERAERYLLLGGSLGVILAGAAVAIAARRYTLHQEGVVAVLKTLGCQSTAIGRIYLQQLALIAAFGIVLGWLAGWGLETAITNVVRRTVQVELPAAGWQPLLLGAAAGLASLFGFALPPLWNLRRVAPSRVLRREVGRSGASLGTSSLIGCAAMFALLLWYTGSAVLTTGVFTGIALTVLVVGALAWSLLRGTHWAGMQAGNRWRLATASLRRRALENALQVVIFAVTIMLFLVLLVMRTSLLDEWQQQLPEGTPNHFLVNIAADEVQPLRAWLGERELRDEGLYPIVRARVTAVNGQPVRQPVTSDGDDTASVDRELNLTWADAMPVDNKLLAGQWWGPGAGAEVSVESRLAERLGLRLGDELRFQVAATVFTAQVTSLREVDWEQMRPNFYMILPEQVLRDMPATYITSFYLAGTDKRVLGELLQAFPTVQVFELDAIIRQVRSIISQVSLAVESILWLVIACGGLVLVAAVRASQEDRMRESAILRTLGAPRRLVMGALAIEFCLLGAISGTLAAAGAELTLALLQTRAFEMAWENQPLVWLLGPMAGGVLVGTLGVLACRGVVRRPPLSVLRALEE